MKIRNRNSRGEKIETQMAPMIDVVFQLLIFFLLTLKIIEEEGDFEINMPLARPAESAVDDSQLTTLKVRLEADPGTGQLARLSFNGQELGNGPGAFAQLNNLVMRSVESLQGVSEQDQENLEVEIDPDFDLNYNYIIQAISACSGTISEGKVISFVGKIKFAPIRETAVGG